MTRFRIIQLFSYEILLSQQDQQPSDVQQLLRLPSLKLKLPAHLRPSQVILLISHHHLRLLSNLISATILSTVSVSLSNLSNLSHLKLLMCT